MVEPEGLQHAPEAVTEMNRQGNEPEDIEKCVEKIAQQLLHGNRDEDGFGREGETKNMDNKKCQEKQSGVGHGFRGEWVLDNTGANSVSGVAHRSVLVKQVEADENMGQKNNK